MKGRRFGRLTVINEAGKNKHGHKQYRCLCNCGGETVVLRQSLKSGRTSSCGCLHLERTMTKGGLSQSDPAAYQRQQRTDPKIWARKTYWDLKRRATKAGIPFNLTIGDILAAMPEDSKCPIFGAKFQFGGGYSPNNPSIDRVCPVKGYTQGNIAVISRRANTIKQDATAIEIYKVANWLSNQEG